MITGELTDTLPEIAMPLSLFRQLCDAWVARSQRCTLGRGETRP